MDNNIRENLTINVKTVDLLNEQVAREAKASATYLAMASWCEQQGFHYSAKFFYEQSAEEREHMMKIFKFINDNGGAAYSPKVPAVPHEFTSLLDVYQSGLQEEISISNAIKSIYITCRKENDIATELFLQWFINEQLEEEETMRNAIEIYELHGKDYEDMYTIDKRMARGREE